MDIQSIVAYPSPNYWAHVPVLEAIVCLPVACGTTSTALPQVVKRLGSWLTSLDEPEEVAKLQGRAQLLADDQLDQFIQSLQTGMPFAAVLTQLTRVLETVAGTPPTFADFESTDAPHVARIVFQYEEQAVGRACLESAVRILQAALDDADFDVDAEKRRLVDLADDERLGPSTRAITSAALRRGIPIRRLTTGSLVQLGEGRFQRRIWTAETDATGAIGEQIAQDKDLTKSLLAAVGVPVPRGRPVTDPDDAWRAALEIGLPVAVKPVDANHGRGISLELMHEQAVRDAFDYAARESKEGASGVIVEKYARGQGHRLLVVGDRLIAAARGEIDFVRGDGQRSLIELVDELNKDPLRGENYTNPLGVVKFEENVLIELKKQGFAPESVPPAGKKVLLKRNGDLTTDVTEQVHPIVAEKAVLAAKVVGLDIAGLDIIAEDISKPLEEQGGVIVEVNAGPGLSHHVAPLYGQPQPVGDAIIDMLFPPGRKARLPIITVTGSGDRAAVVTRIERFVSQTLPAVSSASTQGIFHQGQRIAPPNRTDEANFKAVLLHPFAEAAVIEARPEHALASGMGYERSDIVVILEANDELTSRQVTAVVRAIPPGGTLIAPVNCVGLERLTAACRGSVLLMSPDGETDAIRRHLSAGGRAVYLRDNQLVLAVGSAIDDIELQSSRTAYVVMKTAVLAAAAATWAAGFSLSSLRGDSLME